MMSVEKNLTEKVSQEFIRKVEKDLQKLNKKKVKTNNDKYFINYLFHFLHRNYLKTYYKTANFAQIITKGKYNCVSGTSLIGYFLEYSGYNCLYYETQKHTFLIVELTPTDRILVESTAFFSGGLIDDEEQINIALKNYQPLAQIQAIHLVGLQYYNEGVLAYENQDYVKSLSFANQAYYFYPSTRHKVLCHLAKQNFDLQKFYSKVE